VNLILRQLTSNKFPSSATKKCAWNIESFINVKHPSYKTDETINNVIQSMTQKIKDATATSFEYSQSEPNLHVIYRQVLDATIQNAKKNACVVYEELFKNFYDKIEGFNSDDGKPPFWRLKPDFVLLWKKENLTFSPALTCEIKRKDNVNHELQLGKYLVAFGELSCRNIHYGILPDPKSVIFMKYDKSRDPWSALSISEPLICDVYKESYALRRFIAFNLLAVNEEL